MFLKEENDSVKPLSRQEDGIILLRLVLPYSVKEAVNGNKIEIS